MRQLSKEALEQVHTGIFRDSARCSTCGNAPYFDYREIFKFVYRDGTEFKPEGLSLVMDSKIGMMAPDAPLPDDIHLQCKKCGARWPVYEVINAPPSVADVRETHRSQTTLGDDRYDLANPSQGTATRRLNLEQQWSQSWTIEQTEMRKKTTIASLDLKGIATLSDQIENEISKRYATTENLQRTFSDELTLTLPEETTVTVTIRWKKVWQHGIVTLSDGTEIPFKVAVSLTYDFSQEDVQ